MKVPLKGLPLSDLIYGLGEGAPYSEVYSWTYWSVA